VYSDFGQRKSQSATPLFFSPRLKQSRQSIAEHNLDLPEKQAFLLTLRRLIERHGLLPDRIRMAGNVDISDEILAFGGFADLRSGKYEGRLVAIKTMRVAMQDDFLGIRKVGVTVDHPGHGLIRFVLAILQGSRPLEHAVPSEHLETRWGSGGHEETATRHRVGVDGAREHHGVHWQEPCQQAGARTRRLRFPAASFAKL